MAVTREGSVAEADQDGVVAAVGKHLLRRFHGLREEPGGGGGDDDGHGAGASASQTRGCRGGPVSQLGGRIADFSPGLDGKIREVPEGAGDGADGEPGQGGDVLDGDARRLSLQHGLSPFFPLK